MKNSGLCQCGCGGRTRIAPRTHEADGWIKGQPIRFLRHHHSIKHGATRQHILTGTYQSWQSMKARCLNLKYSQARRYGQRGIKICKRWLGPQGFAHFLADMGERPDGLTIDRKNNDGDYTPRNCRWATRSEQARNQKTTKLTLAKVEAIRRAWRSHSQRELAEMYEVNQSTISRVIAAKRWL